MNRSVSSSLRDNPVATPTPATTHLRVFHLVLEGRVETISRINSPSALSSSSVTINRVNALVTSNRTIQATHQARQHGTTIQLWQFNPTAISSVVKWDIMPTTIPSVLCKPLRIRGTVDKGKISSNNNSSSPEITIRPRKATKAIRTTCVAG